MKKRNIWNLISDAGLKKTKFRMNIIDLLEKNETLLSAQEIYNELHHKDVSINLSTVYRTLDKLVEADIINKVALEQEKQILYEFNRDEHHHFLICKSCNKIQPIYRCPLHDYEEKLMSETGFKITSHKIEFYGYCKDCQEKM
jgi:Fur family ferric uptake transcriptional regulator